MVPLLNESWRALIAGPMHMEQMASHSLTRLYLVVSKAVSEETLEYLFGVFAGLEYVDLKRDHASGLSRVSRPWRPFQVAAGLQPGSNLNLWHRSQSS